ncbi:hypothetical protein BAUCODRAFT_38569 [Baudoinia panamericana UAMH 10762]|uniref:Uncharacterized protein n=1 Tax=Baudoinia panamericana (strain UAMH 10762) TaxID=717646 RepID=M2N0S3_BAUPA|nr:uncharacterized protein BAUCODRAFT_38569 [Baudoinia panamericana UAMH 10762]EMC92499.1 hypothetical protein BAUCODRAFT_38569 [Baudoinia panamericana UAMH 10762]
MANQQHTSSTLDPYARPYVPHSLRAVNEASNQHIIPSLPVRWIDFAEYVRSFAGSAFLQPDPPPPELPNAAPVGHKLEPSNYHGFFREALVHEAAALRIQCDDHALYKVPIQPAARDPRPCMYSLVVPGLRELSLAVELGDVVQLRQLHLDLRGEVLSGPMATYRNGHSLADESPMIFRHDAVIWAIDSLNGILTLRVDGLYHMSMQFNVCFTIQVGRIGAMYRAITTLEQALTFSGGACWTRSMLFPDETDGVLQNTLNKGTIRWEGRDKQLNYEQIRAVDTVLLQKYGDIPYLVSGPPGTGKTKTMVELALQLIAEHESSHVIVCAPSDPAADTLTLRLRIHLVPKQLLRLNAPSRSFPEVPQTILPYCHVDEDMFSLPPFQQLMRYRIVVVTCRDAEILVRARLSNADLVGLEQGVSSALHPENAVLIPPLHWTGLLIDEAAQATEPEACIALTVVAPPEGYEQTNLPLPLVVMAGDQNQLGPRTASKIPALQTSLFERLLARPLYRDHPLARSKQTGGVMRPLTQQMLPIVRAPFANLIRNYRSHPAILATPSSLFYHDTLEPEATDTDRLLSWNSWEGRGWPVLFACNTGADDIEGDGGGWYNRAEANMACQFAYSFLQSGLIEPRDICIMSPFRAQVKLIRRVARGARFRMHGVSIGPLEAFQGLESRLVIICTTRTRDRFIEQDLAKGLGVIREPKRFNVALTRAKEGLIVIGNPIVLRQDEYWRNFLAFCQRNGLWKSDALGEQAGSAKSMGDDDAADFVVSRLERQLLHQDELQADSAIEAANGMRKLNVYDPEREAWEAGLDAELYVQEIEELIDGES